MLKLPLLWYYNSTEKTSAGGHRWKWGGTTMKISTKGRYALRMMVDLAVYDRGEYISLRDVAERQDVSMKYMEQIVSQLGRVDADEQL